MNSKIKGGEGETGENSGHMCPVLDILKSAQNTGCPEKYGMSGNPNICSKFSKMTWDFVFLIHIHVMYQSGRFVYSGVSVAMLLLNLQGVIGTYVEKEDRNMYFCLKFFSIYFFCEETTKRWVD